MHVYVPKIGWVALFCLSCTLAHAQVGHRLSLNVPTVKDRLNNGLLFWGGGLTYTFSLQKNTAERVSIYEAKLGLQAIQRGGLLGVGLQIQPISYFYGFKLSQTPEQTIWLGPKAWVGYQLFLYPDLQMGHALWLSNLSLAPQVMVDQRVGETNRLVAKVSSSVFSVTSRPDRIEPYFFSLRAGDLLRDLHSNLNVGSLSTFSQTDVSVDYRINGPKRDWAVGYDLSYIHYKKQPAFQSLVHGVSLTFFRR